jgi:hypothetical protein
MNDDMGKADWIYDEELGMHIPCCTRIVNHVGVFGDWKGKCGNGPLEGEALLAGDCGKHGPPA